MRQLLRTSTKDCGYVCGRGMFYWGKDWRIMNDLLDHREDSARQSLWFLWRYYAE